MMIPAEELQFLSEVYKLFPSLQDFTMQKPTIVDVWLDTLAGNKENYAVSFGEAMGVLERWRFGTLPNPPTAPWARELLATHIRAVVEQDRVAASKFNWDVANKEEQAKKLARRQNGNPGYQFCRPLFDRCLAVNEKVMLGLMSRKDGDWEQHHICNELYAIEKSDRDGN